MHGTYRHGEIENGVYLEGGPHSWNPVSLQHV